jgi:hypothetical protein
MPLSAIHLAAWSRTCLQGSSLRRLRPGNTSRGRPAAKGIKEAAAANAFMYMMAENARPMQTCQVRLTGVWRQHISTWESGGFRLRINLSNLPHTSCDRTHPSTSMCNL